MLSKMITEQILFRFNFLQNTTIYTEETRAVSRKKRRVYETRIYIT